MMKAFRTALIFFTVATVSFGFVYPTLVWFIGQTLMPRQANGSLLLKRGEVVGSLLIGQNFTQAKYFWPRVSETNFFPYNPAASGSAALNPAHPDLAKRIAPMREKLNLSKQGILPADMVTASASGLDPHISISSALLQIHRVARARNLSVDQVRLLVKSQAIHNLFDSDGSGYVNVVQLNHLLDTSYGDTK